MSFLLDALRKSEQSGRRRSAPTIHSAALPAGRGDGARDDLLPLLAFVAPAFVVMAGLGWQMFGIGPFAGPAVQTQAAANAPPQVDEATMTGSGQEASADNEGAGAPVNAAPQFVGGGRPVSASPRTPVEQVRADASPVVDPGSGPSPAQAPAEDPLAAAARAIQQAAAESRSANAGAQRPRVATQDTPAAPKPATPAAERQNHIDYWELPGNVRNQLPEMKISVLVYADSPADRFVLVNGQRLYEGDELQSGLALSEITREGAIFSFRRYRFMYTH